MTDPFDSQHNAKRRLVDTLNGLSIGKNHGYGYPFLDSNSSPSAANAPTSSLFGTFTQEQLNKPLSDPHKVYIKDIDQFLHENPDQLDIIGEKLKLNDLRKAGLDKLVISCGLDIRKAWGNIVNQYRTKNYENKNIDDLIYKMIWEDYIAKYFSLVKFYNPLKVVWDNYQKWLYKKNHKAYVSDAITELDDDGDEMMGGAVDDDDDDDEFPDNDDYEDDELSRLASREQSLRDGMSSYGSYYTHDEHDNFHSPSQDYNYNLNNNYHNQPMYDNDGDDVMMED